MNAMFSDKSRSDISGIHTASLGRQGGCLFELVEITEVNNTLKNQALRTMLPLSLNDLLQDPQDERRLLASRYRVKLFLVLPPSWLDQALSPQPSLGSCSAFVLFSMRKL
jgi:hypothetical protein